ncbi:putative membrane protein [Wenzhouxiangella marina]|nr:putative membrane protein [Wenzhouxiangella marina]
MSVAFSVVYLLTGSWALGGAIALIEPAINTVAYFVHEKLWERFGTRGKLPMESLGA